MKKTNFNYENIKLDYSSLLSMLQDGSFKTKYPKYQISKTKNYFIIKNDDDNFFFVIYNNELEVIIEFEGVRLQERFKINSSLDFEKICKDKKISLDSLYIRRKNGILQHYEKNNSFPFFINIADNKITFISKEKEPLPQMI